MGTHGCHDQLGQLELAARTPPDGTGVGVGASWEGLVEALAFPWPCCCAVPGAVPGAGFTGTFRQTPAPSARGHGSKMLVNQALCTSLGAVVLMCACLRERVRADAHGAN